MRPVVAGLSAPSAMALATNTNPSTGASLSFTSTLALAVRKLAADAWMRTVRAPSTVVFVGAAIRKDVEYCPAGIVTVAGGNKWVGKSLITVTASAVFVGVLRVRK